MAAEWHVVLSGDELVAMPIAVAARSLVDARPVTRPLVVHVIDCGISDRSFGRITRSLPAASAEVLRHRPDLDRLQATAAASGSSYPLGAFARLLLPSLLPPDLGRVVYLDPDLVVRRDPRPLFETSFDGMACLAARDADGDGHVGGLTRIDWRSMGAPGDVPLVNTGVMVIDLDAWRAEAVTDRSIALVERFPGQFRMADQDILNIVLAGRVGLLDPRWNVYTALLDGPCRLDPTTHAEVLDDPWVVHFTNRPKPWEPGCRHPRTAEFFAALDRTAWSGWRPSTARNIKPIVLRALRRARRVVRRA